MRPPFPLPPSADGRHDEPVWSLTNEALLVTCGSMAQASLYGDSLKLVPQPSKVQQPGAAASGRILVSYGSAVTWTLDAQDVRTCFVRLAPLLAPGDCS